MLSFKIKQKLVWVFVFLCIAVSVWIYTNYYTQDGQRVSIQAALQQYPLTTDASPWEILHGIVAFGKKYEVFDENQKKGRSAVDYICTQREVFTKKGLQQVIVLNEEYPRFIRTDQEALVEAHPGQFVAKLLCAGVGLDQGIDLYTKKYTLADMWNGLKTTIDISALSRDLPPMGSRDYRDFELGWMLEALSFRMDEPWTWNNAKGKAVSLEQLVALGSKRPIGWGSCGGTHELLGLARCVASYQARGGKREGVWQEAYALLEEAKKIAQKKQNSDGSYDRRWTKISIPPFYMDEYCFVDEKIYMTGHMLAWLIVAASPEELNMPFIKKAFQFLSKARVKKEDVIASYGAFTHAQEAMCLYQQRMRE